MQLLRANTQVVVRIGPFVDVGDGFTPQTDIGLAGNEAELLKAASVEVDISGRTWAAITNCRGWYDLTLTTDDTDTEGTLVVVVQDDSDCLPVFAKFMVMAEAAWDSMFVAKDTGYMDVNIKAISEDTTAPDNLELMYDGTGYAGGTIKLQTDLTQILAHTLTDTGTQLADGFQKFFDVSSPTGTVNSLPDAVPGAAGGVAIAGSNAATTFSALTVTNALLISGTTTFTGAVSCGSTFDVVGAFSVNSLLVDTTTTLTGNVSLGGTLGVTGITTFTGAVNANITGDITGDLSGTVSVCTTNTDMRGTNGANTTVPDAAGTAAGLHATTDAYIDVEIGTIITAVGTTLNNHLLDIKGTGFAKDTHSLPQCLTATGFATPTNITAGTITTVTNLTNAPTSGDLTATMKTSVNTECDTALTDYDPPTDTEMVAAFTEIKGATWAATDSLEAIRNQGDSAWITATGFATPTNITAGTITTVSGNVDGSVGTCAAATVSAIGANVITGTSLDATACTKIIDDFETQCQADPTGFHVNLKEINGTAVAGDGGGTPWGP